MTFLRSLALGAAAVSVAAQAPPANIGAWEQIAVSPTSPSLGPYGWFAHKPTTVAGTYICSGGDPSGAPGSNLTAAYQFDMTTLTWSRYPDAPSWTYLAQLYSFGGYVFGLAEDHTSLAFISTDSFASPGAGWTIVALPNPPPTRYHARSSVFGGILYLFGGSSVPFNISYGQTYNDLWGLDLNDVFNSVFVPGRSAQGWAQLISNGTAGMPRARAGHLMVSYGHHVWIYGGFEAGPYASNHMWSFAPGNQFSQGTLNSGNINYNPTMFAMQSATAVYQAGATPPSYTRGGIPALIEATGSVYGDHLFVFGGWGNPNPNQWTQSTDLWVYTFPTATWFIIPQSAPWPQLPLNSFPGPAGVTIGRHLYIAVPAPGNSGFTQLWRWGVNPFFQPPGSGTTVEPIPASWHTGTTAGLVIAILLNIATLAFTVVLWRRQSGGGGLSVPTFTSSSLPHDKVDIPYEGMPA